MLNEQFVKFNNIEKYSYTISNYVVTAKYVLSVYLRSIYHNKKKLFLPNSLLTYDKTCCKKHVLLPNSVKIIYYENYTYNCMYYDNNFIFSKKRDIYIKNIISANLYSKNIQNLIFLHKLRAIENIKNLFLLENINDIYIKRCENIQTILYMKNAKKICLNECKNLRNINIVGNIEIFIICDCHKIKKITCFVVLKKLHVINNINTNIINTVNIIVLKNVNNITVDFSNNLLLTVNLFFHKINCDTCRIHNCCGIININFANSIINNLILSSCNIINIFKKIQCNLLSLYRCTNIKNVCSMIKCKTLKIYKCMLHYNIFNSYIFSFFLEKLVLYNCSNLTHIDSEINVNNLRISECYNFDSELNNIVNVFNELEINNCESITNLNFLKNKYIKKISIIKCDNFGKFNNNLLNTNVLTSNNIIHVYDLHIDVCNNLLNLCMMSSTHTVKIANCRKINNLHQLKNSHCVEINNCSSITDVSMLKNVKIIKIETLNVSKNKQNIQNIYMLGNIYKLYLSNCKILTYKLFKYLHILHIQTHYKIVDLKYLATIHTLAFENLKYTINISNLKKNNTIRMTYVKYILNNNKRKINNYKLTTKECRFIDNLFLKILCKTKYDVMDNYDKLKKIIRKYLKNLLHK